MNPLENLYSELLRVRDSQVRINEAIAEKRFKIPVHLALGHESASVATAAAMSIKDKLILNHRNIHYHLALGATYEQLFAEYSLLPEGLGRGKLGSMNLVAVQNRNVYTSNILGNNLAVALGVAQSAKIREDDSVTWVVTGDGAMEEGVFYESLLCASTWELPLVVIIENNGWSLGTKINERRYPIDVQKLSESTGSDYFKLQGNRVDNYLAILSNARELAKLGKPIVVEIEVETLGGYYVEEEANSRYINYHAGKATFSSESMVIVENSSDPIYANQEILIEGGNE